MRISALAKSNARPLSSLVHMSNTHPTFNPNFLCRFSDSWHQIDFAHFVAFFYNHGETDVDVIDELFIFFTLHLCHLQCHVGVFFIFSGFNNFRKSDGGGHVAFQRWLSNWQTFRGSKLTSGFLRFAGLFRLMQLLLGAMLASHRPFQHESCQHHLSASILPCACGTPHCVQFCLWWPAGCHLFQR